MERAKWIHPRSCGRVVNYLNKYDFISKFCNLLRMGRKKEYNVQDLAGGGHRLKDPYHMGAIAGEINRMEKLYAKN